MIGHCTKCGTAEHMHLLDGKSPTGDENDDFTAIECIKCYGSGWCPTGGPDDIKLSIAADLKPFYDRWLAENHYG
jgi:hypothetical protein